MFIYCIRQSENRNYGSIAAAVVAATDEHVARNMHPESGAPIADWSEVWSEWCKGPKFVEVQLLGSAAPEIEAGVLLKQYSHNE